MFVLLSRPILARLTNTQITDHALSIRIELAISVLSWDCRSKVTPGMYVVNVVPNLVPRAMPVRGLGLALALGKRNRSA